MTPRTIVRTIAALPVAAAGILLTAAAVTQAVAFAQDAATEAEAARLERRTITIDSSGGTQSGNLRYGPIDYRHDDPRGISATVSTLRIFASIAQLRAPADTLLSQAKGQRTATFDGGVFVERGRMTAEGPTLTYAEADGIGTLAGGVQVVVAADPDAEDGNPTEIAADAVDFDVDLERSVSRGDVVLVSGVQRAEADEVTYAETTDLGRLRCDDLCTIVRDDEDGVLTITADVIRVLTQEERLYAAGRVTVVDGDLVTVGDAVVYDDEDGVAEIVGSPARSVDEKNGVTLESDRIRQDVRYDFVEAIDASQASDVDLDAFLFPEELADADGDAQP